MSDPAFTRTSTDDPLFILDTSGNAASAPSFTWAFMPATASTDLTLTPAQSFAATGLYILVDKAIADQAAFVQQVEALLPGIGTTNLRFLWITTNGSLLPQEWQLLPLRASATSNGTANLTAPFVISYNGGYMLQVINRAVLAVTTSAFTLSAANNGQAAQFSYGTQAQAVPSPVTVPLDGATVGCFGFSVSLTRPSQGPSDFEQLGFEIRYFAADDSNPRDGLALTFRCPVLEQPASTALQFTGAFDPLAPLTPSRTYLQFAGTPPALPCKFVSTTGQALNATPQPNPVSPLVPARMVFAASLTHTTPSNADPYYMCPEGAYALAPVTPAGQTFNLMCGASGVESVTLNASGSLLHFVSGQAAFAVKLGQRAGLGLVDDYEIQSLTDAGRTSWVYPVNSATLPVYFAQPNQALLYSVPQSSIGANDALAFQPVPAGSLPVPVAPPAGESFSAFPMAPYTGVATGDTDQYEELEASALSPTRRNVIAQLATASVETAQDAGDVVSTTPSGILVTLDQTLTQWKTVVFGNSPASASPDNQPRLFGFANVQGGFRAAIQTNKLFSVIADPALLSASADLTYRLNNDAAEAIRRHAGRTRDDGLARLLDAAVARIGGDRPRVFQSFGDLFAEIEAAAGQGIDTAPHARMFEQETVDDELCIDKWSFKLSPVNWRADTIMILKYVNRSINELVGDPGAWTWPAAAARPGGSLQDTQTQLRSLILAAREAVAKTPADRVSEYAAFLSEIIDDPAWTGVLFLNVKVPPTSLPPQLQGLAAGIDFDQFKAHHFAISATPIGISDNAITTQPSSLLALIDYQNPGDQFVNAKVDYAFKVTSLQVLFKNSTIANFFSQIQLQINTLFSAAVLLAPTDRGNNVVLTGTYQVAGDGTGYYDYSQTGSNRFAARSNVLDEVETLSCHYVSVDPQQVGGQTIIGSRFEFVGRLRFFELDYFDAFSFGPIFDETTGQQIQDGYLSFSNLVITMSFPQDHPDQVTFTFEAGGLALDIGQSVPRPMSLFRHFPLTFNGLIAVPQPALSAGQADAVTPGSFGYIECVTPLQPGHPNPPWYGLVFDLDLGTLGSLAGNQKLGVSVIAAWGNSGEGYNVYIGLKLPGSNSAKPEIPIEGLLKLAFAKVEFTSNDSAAGRSYMLKLRQIVLRILLLSFPPGNVDLYLFGDPAARTGNSALGWYAGYTDE
jgi:hypothetical protein